MADRALLDRVGDMHSFKAHRKPISSIEFAADGRSLITADANAVRQWSVPEGERLDEWPDQDLATMAALSPHGDHLAIGGVSTLLQPLPGKSVRKAHYSQSVAYTNDGTTVFGCGHHGLARWRVSDAETLDGFWGGTRLSNNGRNFPVGALAVHPHLPLLAASFGVMNDADVWESAIEFFQLDSGLSVRMIRTPHHFDHLSKLRFSPDGSIVVAISGPMWRAWTIDSEAEIARVKTGRKHLLGVAFTADGERLITVGNDAFARVWNVHDGTEERSFDWDVGPLTCLAVSPDGCLLAAGSRRGKVVLWDDEPR